MHMQKVMGSEVFRLLWDTEPAREHQIHFRSWVFLQRVLTCWPLAGLHPPLRHTRQTSKHRSQVDHMFLFFFQVLCGWGPPPLQTVHLGPPDWCSGPMEASFPLPSSLSQKNGLDSMTWVMGDSQYWWRSSPDASFRFMAYRAYETPLKHFPCRCPFWIADGPE